MSAPDSASITGIVWRRVDPARETEAEELMRSLMMLSRASTGFLGSEIFPPIAGVQDAYVVLYRFNSAETLRSWLGSPVRRETLAHMETLLLEPSKEFYFAHRRREPGTVSSVFSYRVKPGSEDAFADWRQRILEEVRTWHGFLGTESFDTLDTSQPELVAVVRFDSRSNLDAWLQSRQRQGYIDEVHRYVEDYRVRRIGTGFEGWFEYSDVSGPPVPWRQGMIVLAALFPVITTLQHLLAFLFNHLPSPVAFLILLTIDVTLLTYVIMPHFSRWMGFWLRPGAHSSWRTELGGWAILLGLIAGTLTAALSLS
ncbi:hypothetical protein BH09VER1_BH09VER1_15270 [soil metagenome]